MDFVVYQDEQVNQHRIDDQNITSRRGYSRDRRESEVEVDESRSSDLDEIRRTKPKGILQDIIITPYLQRNFMDLNSISSDASIYSLYLAMYEPQKRLHIYKKTAQRIMTISDGYGRISLDFSQHEELSEKFFKARMWYIEVLRCFELWASWDPITTILNRETILDALLHIIKIIPRAILEKVPDQMTNGSSWITQPKSDKEDLSEILECIQLILTSKDEINRILHLRGEQAQSFLDLLDGVVTSTDPHSRISDLSQRTLRRLCGRAGLLPTSFILNEGLTKESHHPVATGGFADVFYGQYSGRPVALKALRIFGADSLKRVNKKFCKEAVFWRRLSHTNIVPFLGVSSPDSISLCMVSAWMDHGNLLDYIKKNPKSNRMDLVVDIVRGLLYIHTLGLVHGDLKSANVLINNMHQACLSDFGLSNITHDARTASLITTSNVLHGSIRWMAPELLHPEHAGRDNEKPSAESDIYAFAMVMLEVFTGKIPFHYHLRDATVVLNVTLGIRPKRPSHTAAKLGLTDAVWAIMEKCWQADWQKRPLTLEISSELEESRRLFVHSEIGFDEDNIALQIDNSDSDSSSDGEDGPSFRRNFTKMSLNDNSEDTGYHPPVFSITPDTQRAHMTLENITVPDINVEEHYTPSNEVPPNSSWGIFDI